MGCCPSTETVKECTKDTVDIERDKVESINIYHDDVSVQTHQSAPNNIVIDREEDNIEQSMHVVDNAIITVSINDDVCNDSTCMEIADVCPLPPSKTAQTLASPSKRTLSADEMPITSMYHRIHLAETEEQELAKREAQRLESERREQEIREFKVSLRTP